ncbi:glycosyltransferase [Tautonia sociabilis]|uniref:Glycosyltransferase n=1 Tax=Tautonia sociabilis TaxID=2080755 RepID=A0A432MFA5_9BACT|nr:glycosyltransferase [Tautonia sociabilis]RUL84885.1 glycosyltransferase [Tautonia sociabilis]
MPDRPEPRRIPGNADRRPANPVRDAPGAGEAEGPVLLQAAEAIEHTVEDRGRRIRALEARLAERDRLGMALRERITERALYATWLESEVARREDRLGELARELEGRSAELARFRADVAAMQASRTWKAVATVGRLVDRARSAARAMRGLPARVVRGKARPIGGTPGIGGEPRGDRLPEAPLRDDRPPEEGPRRSAVEPSRPRRDRNAILTLIPPRVEPYDEWLRNNAWNAARRTEAERDLGRLTSKPVISVVVAAAGETVAELRETLASIREQVYPERDVILVGGSTSAPASMAGRARARGAADGDGFEALRAAASEATGEYLVVLDGRTRLAPDALLEIARAATVGDEPAMLVFGDEDRVDAEGRRFGPRFRPGWSPELLLATPAIGRVFAVRRSDYEAVGGLRPEFGEAWPYDLALRLAERPGRVARVPRVLWHVSADREGPDPVEAASARTIGLAARAVSEALGRRGIEARVCQPGWASRQRFPAFELEFPDRGPRAAVLIPSKDRVDLLRRCVASVRERTTYRDFEIVILDNGSVEPETLEYLDGLGEGCRVLRIENEGGRFNYARLHNKAITLLGDEFEFVVLLNNDTEVRRGEWLSQLVGYGGMEGVGAVGARLLYGDGRIQHAGMLTDLHDGLPGHAFKSSPWWDAGDQRLARLPRNLSAVTAACMLVRRSTFLELGGFDERRFAVGYNDVDFCLRLLERGLRCVYAPKAELLHFEGATRGTEDDPTEASAFRTAWGHRSDPYHHPALSRGDERLGISTRRAGPIAWPGGRPARVLIALDQLDATGAGQLARGLAEGVRGRGLVEVEVLARGVGPIADRLRDEGVRVTIARDREEDLLDRLSRGDLDLLHVVGLGEADAIEAARSIGLPTIWTIREAVDFRDAFSGLGAHEARGAIGAFSAAYRVVFPAWGVRRPFHPVESRWNFEVVREAPRPIADPPTRLEARRRLGLAAGSAVVACVHESDDRGAEDFVVAASELIRSGRELSAVVLAPEGMLRSLAREEAVRSMPDRFRLISGADDPGAALAASDLLVIAQRRDPAPAAIALGRAFGAPMAVAEVPGVEEFVRPGRSALLFGAGDVGGIRGTVATLLDDEGLRARISQASRVRSGEPDGFEAMVRSYERLYLEAVAVGTGRGMPGFGWEREAA